AEGAAAERGEELSARRRPKAPAKTAASAGKKKAVARAGPAAQAAGEASLPAVPRQETPFERFVVDFVRARGGNVSQREDGDYDASFDPELAKRLRRANARLVFDAERAILPRGGLFAAPGSRLGLALLDLGRGRGHVARTHLAEAPDVDATVL